MPLAGVVHSFGTIEHYPLHPDSRQYDLIKTACLATVSGMTGREGTPQPHPGPTGVAEQTGGSVRPLIDEERAGAPLGDRDHPVEAIRLQHVRSSLAGAVAEGRVAQADADAVIERLTHGEDAHQLRRELRRAGVLPRRAGRPGR